MKVINKIHYNAPVTLTFTFLALLAFELGNLTHGAITKLVFVNYRTSVLDPMQYLRLFTHVLGHANWAHFAGNFTMILLLGPIIEEKYGSKILVQLIIITAFITGLVNVLIFNANLLGASGIVFMMIILSSYANVKSGKIPLTLLLVVTVFLGKEVTSALFVKDNIAHFAHIIGGLCGGVFGYLKTRR
jgi:rhomboid protease GluP